MGERVVLIVNPTATRASTRLVDEIREALTGEDGLTVRTTRARHHAEEIAREAQADGATIVAVLGGDGTVADTADALAGSDTALLPIAAGSTNVFTRALGWPHPAHAAVPLLREAISAPRRRHIHLGLFTAEGVSRTFCINAGYGIDAETVQIIEAHPWIKRRFRHAGFGATALAGALRASRPSGAVVTIDGEVEHTFASFMVATGSPYAYIGSRPLDLVPGAAFDGKLRWLGVIRHRPGVIASVLRGAVASDGTHLGSRDVIDGWAESITIRSDRPIVFQSDGDPLGEHREVTIGVGPSLTVIVPSTSD